ICIKKSYEERCENMTLKRHRQEIYEVLTHYYAEHQNHLINKTSFILRLKTMQQLTEEKIKLHKAINKIFEVEYLRRCKTEKEISKYKKMIRTDLVAMLKSLGISVKYNELTSIRSKKMQEIINKNMIEYDIKHIRDQNYKDFRKVLNDENEYLETSLYNTILYIINCITI